MTKKHSNIEKKVLYEITPSSEDKRQIETVIQKLKQKISQEISKTKIPASAILVGSIAKDTFLKNNLDIDLFLVFPTDVSKEEIAKIAISIGRKILIDAEECYAEHPYIRGYFEDLKTEIVPCYNIEKASQKISAVDRTPLHTKYVKSNITEKQKQDVRLLKQFLKGIGCYGAEAEIEGFSGYLCELLIIKYGSFKKLIQNASNWKYGTKISLTSEDSAFFDTPLIVIDPVDNNRNVASALSKEKFNLFVKACKEYITNPSITFFFPNETKPWTLNKIKNEIKKQNVIFVGVKISKPNIIAENLYPQIRKAVRSIWENCKKYGFTIKDIVFYVDDLNDTIFIIIKTSDILLSKIFTHAGPPVKLKKNTEDFIRKWEEDPRVATKPYVKNGRAYVKLKREYVKITDFLKKELRFFSLGKHLDQAKYEIVELDDILIDPLRGFWTEYLDKKMPWER